MALIPQPGEEHGTSLLPPPKTKTTTMTIHFFKPFFLYDIMWAGAYPSYLQFLYPLNTCLWPVGGSQRTQPEHHADTGRMHRLHTEKTLTSWGITVSTNGPTDYPVWGNKRQVQTSGKRSDLLL